MSPEAPDGPITTGYRAAATPAKIAAVEHAMGIFKPFTADDIAQAVKTMLP
jgi:hypothetical protein